MEEIWKDVVGYEGVYQVSSFGRVRSLDRLVICPNREPMNITGRVLSPGLVKAGYLIVVLCNDVCQRSKSVHRIVATAFIPNPENKRTVNHKDGNKENNHVDNLEWNTYSQNHKHAYDELGRVATWTGKTGIDNPNSKPINQLALDGSFIKRWNGMSDAGREFGIGHKHISACCLGKRHTCAGFRWEYADILK